MSNLSVRNIDGYNKKIREAKAKGHQLTRTVQTGFDPETGEFKTALDPMAQKKNEHMQAQQIQEIAQNQSNVANQQDESGEQSAPVAAAPDGGQSVTTAGDASGGGNSMMIIGGIVALLLIIGVVVIMRKNQQAA